MRLAITYFWSQPPKRFSIGRILASTPWPSVDYGQPKRPLTIIHLFFPASDPQTPDSQHDQPNNFSSRADAQPCVPSIRQWFCFCRPATLQRRPSKATQPIVAHKPRQDASSRRAKRAPWLYELLDAGD